jgi:hypothetical protein
MNGGRRSIGATSDFDGSNPFTVRAGELRRGVVQVGLCELDGKQRGGDRQTPAGRDGRATI